MTVRQPHATAPTTADDDRRRSPRVHLLGQIQGQLVSVDVPIAVVDMSLGGMLIEIDRAIPIDAIEEFSLELGDGETVVLRARAVRCGRSGWRRYRIGFEFVDDGATGAPPDVRHILARGRTAT